jgi:hypothetical protein
VQQILRDALRTLNVCIACGAPNCSHLWPEQKKCCPDCSHVKG